MTLPDVPIREPVSLASPAPRGGLAPRSGALVGGLVITIVALLMSAGVALLAPLGIWIAGRVQRRRGRALTGFGSWLAGTGSVVIGVLALALVIGASLPAGSWRRAGRELDAVRATQPAPPPAWVERIAPGSARRAAATPPPSRTAMIVNLALGFELFTVMLGTLGWGGAMLLGYGARGRWPGAALPERAGADAD